MAAVCVYFTLNQFTIMSSLCRFFEWDEVEDNEDHKLGLKSSEKVLTQLEDVGQQLALVFNSDSSVLAVGGEVERFFAFPSVNLIVIAAWH